MLRDLRIEEYQSARRCFEATPFGPYIDLVNHARLLMPYVEKGTPLESIMTRWGDGKEELAAEEMEKMIYEAENFSALAEDLGRLKENGE